MRGLNLKGFTTGGVRPATDRLREAVFSSLGDRVQGVRVLDLFAGSGSYGLEALSRGARQVTFVEQNRRVRAVLETNLEALARGLDVPVAELARIESRDVLRWTPVKSDPCFDLVFSDPPYATGGKLLDALASRIGSWLNPGGLWIAEIPLDAWSPPGSWRAIRTFGGRGRGDPAIRFLEAVVPE